MEIGYIKLHRSLLKWEWYDDFNSLKMLIHLLLTVNYKDKKWHGIIVKAGSRVIGRNKFADEIGLTIQQVRTTLKKLEDSGEITIKTTNKFTVVGLVKWEQLQERDADVTNKSTNKQPTNNQQITNKQPTNNQQITTTKESKEYKERKESKELKNNKTLVNEVFSSYNLFAENNNLPKIQKLTDARKKLVSARLKNPEDLKKVFEKISNSDFLLNGSFVSFDWIFKQQNFLKILEGNYDNKTPNKKNHGERLQEIYNSLNQ